MKRAKSLKDVIEAQEKLKPIPSTKITSKERIDELELELIELRKQVAVDSDSILAEDLAEAQKKNEELQAELALLRVELLSLQKKLDEIGSRKNDLQERLDRKIESGDRVTLDGSDYSISFRGPVLQFIDKWKKREIDFECHVVVPLGDFPQSW
jgi:chromosome segregation ATPase